MVYKLSAGLNWQLRLCVSIAEGTGLIPGQGIKIPQAIQHS